MSLVLWSHLAGFFLLACGKVRDTWKVSKDFLLLVVTDRISAFDVILPNGIPDKGRVLNQITLFWFGFFKRQLPGFRCHLVSGNVSNYPEKLQQYANQLEGRSMVVKKHRILPIEIIVRGYLAGSGWKEYKRSGTVCGIQLRKGYVESDKLDQPIFTPSTKATAGKHDENISPKDAVWVLAKFFAKKRLVVSADAVAEAVEKLAIQLYTLAAEYALTRGIIIADTKFEFGIVVQENGQFELVVCDEVLTPDSSRFWDVDKYQPGQAQDSFDKQFVRDYLETTDWDKTAPGPELPPKIIEGTRQRYREAYRRITGEELN